MTFSPAGAGLVERSVVVSREQVGFVRYLVEAHEGLALMHGDGAGVVSLLAPESQAVALDALIADLEADGLLIHLR